MKNKRFLSTVVATALAATTMAMPVMAADGGEVEVDVTTRTSVIRVEVPTTLAVAVNQFEKGDTGSQIYSGAFDIKNRSEIPVKLAVKSTATLASTDPVTLLGTKKAAEDSTTANQAWLAVAAKTSATKYTEEDGKDVKDLTEANANVTTFTQGDTDATKGTATAEQIFYLDANATPTVTYGMVDGTYDDLIVSADDAAATIAEAKKISYAQFYELTAIADEDGFNAAVAEGNAYTTETNDAMETILTPVTEDTEYDAVLGTYYKAGSTVVAAKDLTTQKMYMYGEAGDGEVAGFRYIGKLSNSKEKETWSDADLSKIVIKYDIVGVDGTTFGEMTEQCTYGLYTSASASTTATSITPGGAAVEFTVPTGMTVSKVEKTKADGTYNDLPVEHYKWEDITGGKKLTLNSSFTASFGTGKKIKITFSSGNPIELNVQ